ncbi:MAG: AMP-dependent synthetase/ligase [Bacteroidota bacterium]
MKYSPSTILQLFDEGLPKNTTGVFSATKRQGQWIKTSPDEFLEKVKALAMGFYELGIRKGDRISIHSENSTEWVLVDQATLSLGAVLVPIYTTQPGAQIKYILEDSETKIHVVSNDELFKETHQHMKAIKNVEAVISIHDSSHGSFKQLDEVIKMGRRKLSQDPQLFEEMRSAVEPDDLATLIYTSGTTGLPKGVMLSHNNLASNVQASMERVPFDPDEHRGEKMLSYLPLSHVFERMVDYMYMYMGYPIYYIEEIDDIREDFAEIKPFFFATVPRLLEKIYVGIKGKGQEFSGFRKQMYYWAIHLAEQYDLEEEPSGMLALKYKIADKLIFSKVRDLFGGRLIGMISGGAALSPEIMKFVNALGIYCGQGYGQTETSPVVAVTDPERLRAGSSGPVITDVEVKIAKDGEILVKGPNVMQGYFKQREKTEGAFTSDGYLQTGDIGYIDEEGYLFITDRKKSMFKLSTGKYVAPQPIENQLVNSPFIEQAVVVGFHHKFCSALIVPSFENIEKRLKINVDSDGVEAFIQRDDVMNLIQHEVDQVNRDLPKWEKVKRFSLLKRELSIEEEEITPTLKVKRPVINQKYKEQIDAMYENEDQVAAQG